MPGRSTVGCVVERKDFGSWLEGPQGTGVDGWPGQRLGRPERGPGSVARVGRRVVALCADWALSSLLSYALFQGSALAILLIFVVEQWLLVGLFGHSIGHRLLRMQVQTLDGKPVGLLRSAIRAALIALVIPALLVDADQRGLHDRARGSILVRI